MGTSDAVFGSKRGILLEKRRRLLMGTRDAVLGSKRGILSEKGRKSERSSEGKEAALGEGSAQRQQRQRA
eukprot:2780300-Pleurochrysis_carterae.AAC.1